ncbi:MAG: hypothetical protein KF718_06035 [Polyangiaceae bacterium]|nr:hypothetical protein [Polyangiaceae bacterium]
MTTLPARACAALVTLAALVGGCDDRSAPAAPGAPVASVSVAPAPSSTPSAAPADGRFVQQQVDKWFRIYKDGHELGVVEVLAGKPWRLVLHSANDDALALEKLVKEQGAAPISVNVHLPPDEPGTRGPYGSTEAAPGDHLYPFAIEELLRRRGFEVLQAPGRFEDKSPPRSVRKLEFSRDGAKVGTLDLTVTPPKLELVNREGNALFLETFWKGIDAEERLVVSYLTAKDGRDVLTTVEAKKGSPEYAQTVRLAFAVRYPNYVMKVVP